METINEGLEEGLRAGSKERISEILKTSVARGQVVKPRGCPKVNVDTSPEKPESVNLHLRHVGTSHFSLSCIREEMATHSRVLAWRIPGMGEPGGLPSMGSHRVGHG